MRDLFADHREMIRGARLLRVTGRIVEAGGLTFCAEGLPLPIGSICSVERGGKGAVDAQVISVRGDHATLMTLGSASGVRVGDRVRSAAARDYVGVGRDMLGSVLDGMGTPIGGRTNFLIDAHYPVYADPPPALSREAIDAPLPTGIRSIDAMLTIGGGQRMGIFAGTGVGKSVLMGMIARRTQADVIVVALIGERGREVGDFLRRELGDEGMARSVMVVSTSDESPLLRVRAGFVATSVAEYFRDCGKDVLLLLDSTTRIAMAQRQIGLAAGEPPTTKGYPPSAFALLPKLLERSGRTERGSITGLYTVLVEGDDVTEPVSDAIRGVLDGHVWLSRSLANRGHYPAVSVLESVSRLMPDIASEGHLAAAAEIRKVLAVWEDIEDLVNVGAYASGTNAEFDLAVRMKPKIEAFLVQAIREEAEMADTLAGVVALGERIREERVRLGGSPQPAGRSSRESRSVAGAA